MGEFKKAITLIENAVRYNCDTGLGYVVVSLGGLNQDQINQLMARYTRTRFVFGDKSLTIKKMV